MASITDTGAEARPDKAKGPLVYRQKLVTRITHWIWVICLFFLLFTGLNIFNARPAALLGPRVRLRLRQHLLPDRQRGGRRQAQGLRPDLRVEDRYDRRLRHLGPRGQSAAPRLPGVADDPLELQPRDGAGRPLLLRLAVRRGGLHLAAVLVLQRAPQARRDRHAEGRRRACPRTSPTTRPSSSTTRGATRRSRSSPISACSSSSSR